MTDQTSGTHMKVCEVSPPSSQGPASNSKLKRQEEKEHCQPELTTASANTTTATTAIAASNLNSNGKRTHPNSTQGKDYGQIRFNAEDSAFDGVREKNDVPGWAWRNKRAQDESAKAMEMIVDKSRMIASELIIDKMYLDGFLN